VTREHNKNDRRGILVVPNPKSLEAAWGHLAPIISTSETVIRGMDPDSQKAVVDYLQSMIKAFAAKSS
jgi:DNA-binding MarR family transcriptional regulator